MRRQGKRLGLPPDHAEGGLAAEPFTERGIGFPCNAAALERALAACMQDERWEEVSTILDTGVFHDYDMQQLSAILVEGMRPYFYGDSSLENAIDKTQSRLNLYYAERHG